MVRKIHLEILDDYERWEEMQGEMSRKKERISQGRDRQKGKFKVKQRILLIYSSLEGSRVPGPSWAKLGTQR